MNLRPPGAPPLRAVFFDLGDTLMHIHPGVPELYQQVLGEMGHRVSPEAVRSALRDAERIYHDALRSGRGFESSAAEARAFWQEYNEAVLSRLGLGGGPVAAAQLVERFWAPSAWRPFPEVAGVLDALRRAGLRLAVVSNFTEALVALCETHALDGHFDHLFASVLVGSQKPDVGIFREALHRMRVHPAAALHVGDNYVADVLGARAAGIDAVLVDRTRAGRPGMFDFTTRSGIGGSAGAQLDCPVVSDLRELLALVEQGC